MTVEYKDSKRITAVSSDWETDTTSNITWSTTGKVGWDISGTTISRTGSAGWSTSKIQSTDTFTVGDGKFMIEFSGIHNDLNSTMIGFNQGTLGYHFGSGSPQNNCDFAIYVAGGSRVEVYESGNKNYDSGGSRNASDRYRIEVSNSGVVKYYLQEGGTGSFDLKYTSSSTASGTYFIQANAYASTSEVTVHSKTVTTAVAKPSNVQDNSLLVEKDTPRRYWFTSEVNNLTFEDDFSGADNWSKSPSDSQFAVDTSDDRLEFLENASSGGDRCWYDLGVDAVSSTKWLFRAKFRFTTIATQSDYPEFDFGLSDNTVNSDTEQNFMGFRCLPMAANNLFRPRVCTGASGDAGKPRRGASASYNPSPAFTTGTDYYVEIKRTSASNWSCTLSTTNAFDGDIVGGSFTDAGSVSDLRYIKIMDGTTATSGDMAGYVDDVEFYNNVTTPTEPATWLTSSGISKTGCLAHYNFEDTGNTLTNLATTTRGFTDGLGSSANGTNGGATQSQTGVVDNAWSFDNSNDYVNTNISTVVMDTPKTFSISMWIKPNSSSDWSDVLVGQSVGTSDQGMVLWLNSLKPTLYLEGSGGGSTVGLYAPANTVSTGVWNHVVITVVGQSSRASDATGINIYLNGTSQTISTSGSSGTVGTMGVNANMFLGSKHGTTGFFDGLMDEVSIWNRVLTQAEVTTLYNSGKGVGV